MNNTRHIRHYHRHFGFSYPASPWQRFYTIVISPLIGAAIIFAVLWFFSASSFVQTREISLPELSLATLATLARLSIAYAFALVCAIPLALLVNYNALAERIFLPLFDIIESVPVLAFFPVIIVFFVHFNLLNGAAIFILFLTMLWSIVFNIIGGLKMIPADIKYAAHVMGIRGFALTRKVLLPSVVPHLVTGSLLAWAGGWNIIIVAEVLRTYIPGGGEGQDLFGIGSVLVNAASSGQNNIFFAALFFIILAITFLNLFVWQRLLHYAERYKFE